MRYAGSSVTTTLEMGGDLEPGVVYRLRLISANGAGLTSRETSTFFTTEGVVEMERLGTTPQRTIGGR